MSLPTPEQERKAILALMGLLACGVIGIAATIMGAALALIGIARWVWGALA